jgi:NitT/TauT family transport system substrate-binding protein
MCVNCGINRRDFVKMTSMLSAGALLGLSACHKAVTEQPVRVGYLAITDAAPLLVAHSRGLYTAEGLTAEQPRLFRSWAQLSEAFLARQVNVVHVLMPATIWIRYARKFPAKVVAWNHTNGSALTVLPEISSVSEISEARRLRSPSGTPCITCCCNVYCAKRARRLSPSRKMRR